LAAPRVRVYLRTRRLRVAHAGPHVKLPIPVRSNVVVTSDALPYEQLFEGRDEPPAYVGLTTAAAQSRAELDGHPTRVIDPVNGGGIRMDYRPGRLNFLVTEGIVRRAAFF